MVGSKASKTRACPKCTKPSYLNEKGGYYHEYYCRECKHMFYIKNKNYEKQMKKLGVLPNRI